MKILDTLKTKLLTLPIILIVLSALIIMMQQCTISHLRNQDPVRPDTVIVHDTTHITQTIYKPGEVIDHDTTIFVDVPVLVPADTMKILKDYFAKNVYKDTIWFKDNLGYATTLDTIQRNKLKNRKWDYDVKKVTETITITVPEKKRMQLYAGFGTGWNTTDLLGSVAGNIILKTKNDVLYQTQIGLSNDATKLSPFIGFGMAWKIRLK